MRITFLERFTDDNGDWIYVAVRERSEDGGSWNEYARVARAVKIKDLGGCRRTLYHVTREGAELMGPCYEQERALYEAALAWAIEHWEDR